MYLAAKSSYPIIGWNDYSLFVNRSKLPDKKLIVAEIDRALISTNYTVNKYKNSAEKELHRYEFIEIIVRLSLVKYLQAKTAKDIVQSYQMIREEIFPRNGSVMGMDFRVKYMYNLKCDEIFRKNEAPLKAVFETFHTPAKKFLTCDDCLTMIKKTGIKLDLGESKLMILYCESLQTRIDTLSKLEVMQEMRYIEFVCFIARLSHEIYAGTK